MSLILMAQAMKMKVGNPLRKLVLIKLADNANDDGKCWPSHSHIADHCEITPRSVMNHVKALEKAMFLTVEHRVKDNKKQSNMYHLHFEKALISSERDSLPSSEPNSPPKQISSEGDSLPPEGDSLPSSERDSHRTSHSSEPVNEPIICDVTEIFNFWKATFNKKRSTLTEEFKTKIKARLKDGYSPDELKQAIVGCSLSPHHMGQNQQGKKYTSLELILRNSAKAEEFIENNSNYQRRKAYEASTTNPSRKPAGGITAEDVFAGGDSGYGSEAGAEAIREINPEFRDGLHQPVSEHGASGASEERMGQGDSGGVFDGATDQVSADQFENPQGQEWQSEPVSTELDGVSGSVPAQEFVGGAESARSEKCTEAGVHYTEAVEQEHASRDLSRE